MTTKHSHVTYEVPAGTVSAVVRTVHRDGSATVEAYHFVKDGKPVGCFLGYKYRMNCADLRAA